jgi:hypothetical protein
MKALSASVHDWAALRGAVAGEVILPDSPGYDAARRPGQALR